MAFLLLVLNTASAMCIAFREFLRRGGYLTLPFLTSLLFLSWYLPQAWTLLDYPTIAPESLVRLLFMSMLCFWAMVLGWHRGLGRWCQPVALNLPVRRLLLPVYTITLFAMVMRALIEMQPPEVRAMGQWTGIITIIAFFSSVSVVSMALSTAMILKKRNLATLVLFSLNLLTYLPLIFIYFRRADTFEFGLAVLLGLFFVQGRTIPRVALIALTIVGFFFVNAVGELRTLGGGYRIGDTGVIEARLPTLSEIAKIDWLAAVDLSDSVHRSETMNAVVSMEAVAQYGPFTLGAQFWNRMVFAYIPGQLLGHDFKRSLMVSDDALEVARENFFFEAHTGTTSTGFLHPYQDFWFLGCAVWWFAGYVMGRVMRHALRGSILAYALYAATISNAVHMTTHFGYYLFTQSVLIVIAILFVRLWLRRTKQRGRYETKGIYA
ncbi:MAG: hypothetical protein DCO81_07200 [Candidatus Aquiluna sp. XM-24bin5]|nr:MAG: hypothetical protein DCO81_07200 [Candidatus Aquiluna sp. XM-24bin5]